MYMYISSIYKFICKTYAYAFLFLIEILYFCPHIVESANIAESAQNRQKYQISQNLSEKNFRLYWASPAINLWYSQ